MNEPTPSVNTRTRALILMVAFGFGVLLLVSNQRVGIHSDDNHFVYQADAWLDGSLSLTRRPHHQNDWASYETLYLKGPSRQSFGPLVKGFFVHQSKKANHFRTLTREDVSIPRRDIERREKHYFVSFPPGPAVLMVPLVWLFGYGVNDVLFTIFFATLNLFLVFQLVSAVRRSQGMSLDVRTGIWLSVFFGFSTCHLWLAVQGRVWFTALIVGATFHLLYLLFALDLKRPFLAGLCLSFAFASRATLVFSAFFIAWQFWKNRRVFDRSILLKKFLAFAAPCLLIGTTLLAINDLRFANPLEFGHTYLAGGNLQRIRELGLFDPSFIGRNLSAMFLLIPKIIKTSPYLLLSKHGMSVLLSSPALIFLLIRGRKTHLEWSALAVAGIILIPILLYQNTGWEQFSFRFLMDILPLLMVGISIRSGQITFFLKCLIVIGILINLSGALTFQEPHFNTHYREFLPRF